MSSDTMPLAVRTLGFVWRYIDDSGNSTSTRPYADPRIAINLSVWESVEGNVPADVELRGAALLALSR